MEIAAIPEIFSESLVGAARRTLVTFREALEQYGPFASAAVTRTTTTATVTGTPGGTDASKVS